MGGDAYLARIDQHMARGNELMERIEGEIRLNRKVIEDHSNVVADLRQFTRDIIGRVERIGRDEIRALQVLHRDHGKLLEGLTRVLERQDDSRQESRAQTQALLRVIDRMDRLDPGGSGSSG